MSKHSRLAEVLCLVAFGFGSICLAKDVWVQVRSPNFVLIGNAPEGSIRRVGTELEQFRAVVRMLWPEAGKTAAKPVVVVAFKDEASFAPVRPAGSRASDVAGYFLGGEDITYICLNPGARRRLDTVIFHEYVHELLQSMTWGVPTWANEGLAEYYCTFHSIDDGRKAVIGRAITEHLHLLRRSSLVPLEQFLRSEPAAFMSQSRAVRSLHYAQAWLMVHYLMQANEGAYREKFIRYLRAAEQGEIDADKRFQAEFGSDYRGIEKELKKYARQASFSTESRALAEKADSSDSLTRQPIAETTVNAHLGTILLYSNRHVEAESYLLKAIESDPAHGDARTSLGMLCFRQGKLEEASRHLEQAVSSPNSRPLAHYYYVRTVVTSVGGGILLSEGDTAKKEFIIRHLRKVLEGLPGHADSCHLLAYVNLFYGEQIEESLALAKRAIALAPDQKSYLLTLAQLQIHREEFEEARTTLKPLLEGQQDASLRAQAVQVERELHRAEARTAEWPK